MLYLALATIFVTVNSLILKWGEMRGQNRVIIMAVNYGLGAFICGIIWVVSGSSGPEMFTVGLGILTGVLYAGVLWFLMGSLLEAGLALAQIAIRLSIVIPILISIVWFGERPSLPQAVGISVAVGAFALLAVAGMRDPESVVRGSRFGARALFYMAGVFVFQGGVGVSQKLFDVFGVPEERWCFLFCLFSSGTVLALVRLAWVPCRPRRMDCVRGVLFGFSNIGMSWSILCALSQVPASVAFPMMGIGVIIATVPAGMLFWSEFPGYSGYLALFASVFAIFLLAGF
jgi:drug/metabolite transporter (DMT)-like permease